MSQYPYNNFSSCHLHNKVVIILINFRTFVVSIFPKLPVIRSFLYQKPFFFVIGYENRINSIGINFFQTTTKPGFRLFFLQYKPPSFKILISPPPPHILHLLSLKINHIVFRKKFSFLSICLTF